MKYPEVVKGSFIERHNRFVASVLVDGQVQTCHVKNTGRCRELLLPGAEVWLCPSDSPQRKTKYDLVCVNKAGRLINIDAQAPNRVFAEWAAAGRCPFGVPDILIPERSFGSSRLDFYAEALGRKIYIEVKGVTLEERGVVRFPDAPTERGIKHMTELVRAVEAGCDAYAAFVIQMENVLYFEPNRATHPQFGQALEHAAARGVGILAFDCHVTPDSLSPLNPVEIRL